MLAAQSADPRISALLGKVLAERYRIEEIIGVGGMGVVFRAHHLQLKRDVAVKVLRPEGNERGESAQRFMREAESAARLDHENCVRVYDFGVAQDDVHFMVMPVLKGAPIKEVFDGFRTSPRRAMNIATQLFAGLEHAHERNVVHRDLKPDNLFLTKDAAGADHVTIVDFGIAKIMEAGDTGMTQAGMLYGTPAYMSPEQAAGDPLDARSDLFSAGLLLFRLLTGDVPGRAKTALEQLRKRASQEIPPLPASFPEPVRELVAKLCALRADERFQSAGAAGEFTAGVLEAWDAAGEAHDQLVDLPQDEPTFENLLAPDPTRGTTINVPTTPKGPSWLPWAAGGVAAASFALALTSMSQGEAEQMPQVPAATASTASDEGAALPDAPPTDIDEKGEDDHAATDTGEKVHVGSSLLQQLAQVNTYQLKAALPYAQRHALIEALSAHPQASNMVNMRVNLALDLLQAEQSPEPCSVFSTALHSIDAARDPFFKDALTRARAPAGSPESAAPVCAELPARLDLVRAHYELGSPVPVVDPPSNTAKKKSGKTLPTKNKSVGPDATAATGTSGTEPDNKTGQVTEKLGG